MKTATLTGVPPPWPDKLRKLLFALETADNLDQLGRLPGSEVASAEGRLERILESDRQWKLATNFPV